MSLDIERDVAMPVLCGKDKYPLGQMEIGDSILFSDELGSTAAYNAAYYHGKKLGRKFTVRRVQGGWRLWRFE